MAKIIHLPPSNGMGMSDSQFKSKFKKKTKKEARNEVKNIQSQKQKQRPNDNTLIINLISTNAQLSNNNK